jgi:hypothetical protein
MHTYAVVMSGIFIFPTNSLHHGPVDLDRVIIFQGTPHYAATTIPAFIRKQYNRNLLFLRVRHKNVIGAIFYAKITANTDLRIYNQRFVWGY